VSDHAFSPRDSVPAGGRHTSNSLRARSGLERRCQELQCLGLEADVAVHEEVDRDGASLVETPDVMNVQIPRVRLVGAIDFDEHEADRGGQPGCASPYPIRRPIGAAVGQDDDLDRMIARGYDDALDRRSDPTRFVVREHRD
jgi:hypothetical protein